MIAIFPILSLISYAALAEFVRAALWKCLVLYLVFICVVVVLRFTLIPFGLPDAVVILIEECIKAGTALAFLNRKDGLPFAAIAAFGFAEMAAIKPLMIWTAADTYQNLVWANLAFASFLYLNAALMHTITAVVLVNIRRPVFILLAIIPNGLFHLIFNITREIYALVPETFHLNVLALAFEALVFVSIIFIGLRGYRARIVTG